MITTLKDYKIFEKKQKNAGLDILIVDVQEPFKEYFGDEYVIKLNEYCQDYKRVYQIWDSTKATQADYIFPNQVAEYEKKYGGKLNINDVEQIFTEPMWDVVKKKLEAIPTTGDMFETSTGESFIYCGGKTLDNKIGHSWFLCPKELMLLFKSFKKQERHIILVGGAGSPENNHTLNGECLYDIYLTLKTLGVNVEINNDLVYSNKGSQFQQKQ